MLSEKITIEINTKESLSQPEINEIIHLCSTAFDEDFTIYYKTFIDPIHLLARIDGELVSHALWITRWLQIRGQKPMRTAYVEGVATIQNLRKQGFASLIMECLAVEITGYDIGGLSPADTTLYSRLGWEYWGGSLFTRKENLWTPVQEETAMILRTPRTPIIDLKSPLSIEWREGEVW